MSWLKPSMRCSLCLSCSTSALKGGVITTPFRAWTSDVESLPRNKASLYYSALALKHHHQTYKFKIKMPFVKIFIHAVWGTKNRYPFLKPPILGKVCHHILNNAKEKNIYIIALNGFDDHLHCLFAVNVDTAISKHIMLLKGESSYWMNKEKLTAIKFEWADEYFASSVSESRLHKVIQYIKNQQSHHAVMTFKEEYDKFIQEFNFKNDQ
jgi:putative transposase